MPPNRHHTAWLPFARSRLESFSSSLPNIPAQEGCFCRSWQEGLCPGRRQQEWQGLSQPGNDSTATALSVQTSAGSLNVASVKAQWGWQMSPCSRNKQHSPVEVTKTTTAKPERRGADLREYSEEQRRSPRLPHTCYPKESMFSLWNLRIRRWLQETVWCLGGLIHQQMSCSFKRQYMSRNKGIRVVLPHPQQHKYLDTVNPPSMGNISWGGWANLGCVIILSQL